MRRGTRRLPAGQGGASNPTTEIELPVEHGVVGLVEAARTARVGRLIGQGGQGVVHELLMPGGGRAALKWYYPRSCTPGQRTRLEELVSRGAPHPTFLWPQDIVEPVGYDGLTGFGYTMPLRPDRFRALYDHVVGRVTPSFRATVTLGMELSHAFMLLHNEGLCYRDISFGNVFFDPETGDILVCDNDNVGVEGAAPASVRGTPYFMAPEVMRGDVGPSRASDLHSLAVLLFYVLMVGHPLLGRREVEAPDLDADALHELLASNPLFVFDPHDESNRPDPSVHSNVLFFWSIYPGWLREQFVRAFTDGLMDPTHGRVLDGEWRIALARLRDLLTRCATCNRQSFLDLADREQVCWGRRAHEVLGTPDPCDARLIMPPLLQLPRWTVALGTETELFAHHVKADYDFERPIARVSKHPTLELWGLQNLSDETWRFRPRDGEWHPVEPSKSATLVAGAEIELVVDGAVVVGEIS